MTPEPVFLNVDTLPKRRGAFRSCGKAATIGAELSATAERYLRSGAELSATAEALALIAGNHSATAESLPTDQTDLSATAERSATGKGNLSATAEAFYHHNFAQHVPVL